jgi:diguanylate cyclase (GGDEF)-like protein
VDTGLFIALLNPAIALVLAAAFLALWAYRKQRYLVAFACGYALSAVGFLLQYFTLPAGFVVTRAFSGIAFALAASLVAGAIVSRCGRRSSFLAIGLLASAGFAALMWFMLVHPSFTWRILSINFALGGICLVVAADLRSVRARSPADTFLLCVAVLAAANFIIRPPVVLAIYGPIANDQAFHASVYWRSALFSHALFSLLIALCVFTATALEMMTKLRSDSQTDPLSRLLNRRGFDQRAQELLDHSTRGDFPVTLILADLDHFKSINDQYGHAMGDRVIAAFACKLQSAAAGARGVAGRIGGEEFAVLLPWTDLAAARLLAEAVRVLFSTGNTDGFPSGLRVTASFGVAARTGDEHLGTLMQRADEALYKAKQNGRNSVRMSYERPAEFSSGAFAHR